MRLPKRSLLASLAVLALGAGLVAALGATSADAARTVSLPPIRHVWVIVLENEDYAHTFGSPNDDPYLARTLVHKGALLSQYYGIAHESNPNYLALVSGQPPNPDTQSDCQVFTDVVPARVSDGIADGIGCVYPSSVRTIGDQLSAHDRTWRAYEQGMGKVPSREAARCAHPQLNSIDGTQNPVEGDAYATRHNPFMYFHSVIDDQDYCDRHVVALTRQTGLAHDLRSISTTPAYSFVTPDLCSDGHDDPCKNRTGAGSALANIDTFLHHWVPKIMNSPAYKKNGLIEITFDESDGPQSDSSACCGEQPGPASALPGITGAGGGRIGAVLLSPFIDPGTRTSRAYNHYSTLASMEKLFGLALLGDARSVTSTFGKDVFTAKR